MRGPFALFVLLSLFSVARADSAPTKSKVQVRAVIDRKVGGRVVKRTVVMGTLPRHSRPARGISVEQELSAARKGWSLTDEEAELPSDLTLGGRLEESSFRRQTGDRSILELERPGARHLGGEEETVVYRGGRRTRVKRLPRAAEPAMGVTRRGHGMAVAVALESTVAKNLTRGDQNWVSTGRLTLRYDPAQPYAAILVVDAGNQWELSRDDLARALETGRAGDHGSRISMRADGHWFDLILRGSTTSIVRVSRRDIARFVRSSNASVPRGTETAGADIDGELGRMLDGQ